MEKYLVVHQEPYDYVETISDSDFHARWDSVNPAYWPRVAGSFDNLAQADEFAAQRNQQARQNYSA